MKKPLLITGICVCGLMGFAKIWGLIILEFSVKQTVYAATLLAAALAMFTALRTSKRSSDDRGYHE
jgi:hypothetical protein